MEIQKPPVQLFYEEEGSDWEPRTPSYYQAEDAQILAQPCVVEALEAARKGAWEREQSEDALLVRTVAAHLRAAGAEVPSPLAEAEESALLTHPVVVAALGRARPADGPSDVPLLELLYTFAEAWADLLVGNNCPRVNAVSERARRPRGGDLVFERTHRLGARNADMAATLGVLLAVEQRPLYPPGEWDEAAEGRPCPAETTYVIRTLDGRRFTWTNASLVALPVCTQEAWQVAVVGGALGEMRSATVEERADSLFVSSYTRMLPAVRAWLST
jgi:hypothetical protein